MGCGDDEQSENYECRLSGEMQQMAQRELREDETTRSQALTQMRHWIDMHPDIQNCRKDAVFLLRFLRTKKFSLPLAQEMLEKYLIGRTLYPQWFQKLDVLDPVMQDILDSGYVVPLKERDSEGRIIIFSVAGKFDPHKYSSSQLVRIHSIVVESLMDDEENQILGYTHVNDESGLTMSHISLWSFSDVRNLLRCIQNAIPMRLKFTHWINVPSYANTLFDFFTSLLNDKLKTRVKLHKDIDSLKAAIDPKILPKEYGGVVPMADMIADYKKFLETKREKLLALDDMKIVVDKKSKFVSEFEDQGITGTAGSFRKLQVD